MGNVIHDRKEAIIKGLPDIAAPLGIKDLIKIAGADLFFKIKKQILNITTSIKYSL